MSRTIRLIIFTITSLLSLMIPGEATSKGKGEREWNQWRGPSRDGQVAGPAWPMSLSEDYLEQRWRVALGPSYSGPIVSADTVFVTETKDKTTEVVRALSRSTGKELWKVEWPGAMSVPFFAKSRGDWIRATPAYDGKSLFVAGMRDVLVSLDAQSGKENWRVDFVKELQSPLPEFGLVCSPLIDGDFLYIQASNAMVKLHKKTGKILWRTLESVSGIMTNGAFSSPVLADLAGKRQLIVQTREELAGLDPVTGTVLWRQIFSDTLPISARITAPRPWLPTTTRSGCSSLM